MNKLYPRATSATKKNFIRIAVIFFAAFLSVQCLKAQAPVISTFSPASGPAGTVVTISGSNFNSTPAGNIVYFGAVKANVNSASSTSLSVTAPSGATYQPVSVLNTATALTGFSNSPYGYVSTFSSKQAITSGDLAAQQTFTTGTGPWVAPVCDIDGDGKSDVITVNYTSGTISILRNTSVSGSVSFASKVDLTLPATTNPGFVAAGDLDGDGKPDLVECNEYTSSGDATTVSVFLNTSVSGNISFASKADFSTNYIPFAVAIGDLDGDGKPDLAVVNYYYTGSGPASTGLSLLRNTSSGAGNISFAPQVYFTTNVSPAYVSIGDLDGDGKADIAVANSGGFSTPGNTVSVFHNTSTPGSITTSSFAAQQTFATGNAPYYVGIADIDGDGKSDLAVSNYNDNTISILRNTSSSGSISFASKVDFATGAGASLPGIGDIDGDGKLDIAVPNWGTSSAGNTISVLRNTAVSGSITASSFASQVTFATGSAPYGASIGDIDGDGKSDVVIANSGYDFSSAYAGNTISVLRNTTHPWYNTSGGASSLNTLANWGSNSNGSGTKPADFSAPGAVFQLANSGTSNYALAGDWAVGGSVNIPSSSILDLGSHNLSVTGTLTNNGTLTGSNTITNSDFINGGTVAAGTVSNPGILSLTGNFDNSIGALNIKIGGTTAGTNYDQLAVSGTAVLSGILNVNIINSFTPLIGDQFVIMTFTSATGTFATTNLPNSGWSVIYNPTNVTLKFSGVLPLKLLSFTGKLINGDQASLSWKVAEEVNVDRYEIEWSSDSRSWKKIGAVHAENTGNKNYSYVWTQSSPVDFYRLKMIDIDGKVTYSPVLRINESSQPFTIYPNPAKNNVTISFTDTRPGTVLFINSSGKSVLQKITKTAAANVDISSLPRGEYIVRIIQGEKTMSYKLVKQ